MFQSWKGEMIQMRVRLLASVDYFNQMAIAFSRWSLLIVVCFQNASTEFTRNLSGSCCGVAHHRAHWNRAYLHDGVNSTGVSRCVKLIRHHESSGSITFSTNHDFVSIHKLNPQASPLSSQTRIHEGEYRLTKQKLKWSVSMQIIIPNHARHNCF